MTDSKTFSDAMTYLGKAFPGFQKWLDDNPAQTQFIAQTLDRFSYAELKAAIDALYAADKQPQGYSKYARELKALILSAQPTITTTYRTGPQIIDGRLTFSCPRCRDQGYISVLNPSTLKRLYADDPDHSLRTCCVICDCESARGLRGTQWRAGYMLILYENLLDESIERHDVDMWDIAREILLHQQQPTRAQELRGEDLP